MSDLYFVAKRENLEKAINALMESYTLRVYIDTDDIHYILGALYASMSHCDDSDDRNKCIHLYNSFLRMLPEHDMSELPFSI